MFFIRSADGTSGGFTFTSGNGRAFSMGSSGTGPEGVSGGASFSGGNGPESSSGSFAFSSSHSGKAPKKVAAAPGSFKGGKFLNKFLSFVGQLTGFRYNL